MKRIVVTGGAGFIGSHVVELLCNSNYAVTVIDNLSFGYKHFIDKRATFVRGNIGNKKLMESVLRGCDAVIHLAASSIIEFSFTEPEEYYKNNVFNSIILLEAMKKNNVKTIIFSSSASVYGFQSSMSIVETAPTTPITIYGSSKLAFEHVLRVYNSAFGINSTSLRYFNAYGPRDQQQPATRAVPKWIRSLLTNRPVEIFWRGLQLRDYVYVKDIAQAHIDVLSKKGYNIYNIGCGKGIYMIDLLKELEKIAGKKAAKKHSGKRAGDPPLLVADVSKIRKEVGWKPKVSLTEGLRQTYRYYETLYNTTLPKTK